MSWISLMSGVRWIRVVCPARYRARRPPRRASNAASTSKARRSPCSRARPRLTRTRRSATRAPPSGAQQASPMGRHRWPVRARERLAHNSCRARSRVRCRRRQGPRPRSFPRVGRVRAPIGCHRRGSSPSAGSHAGCKRAYALASGTTRRQFTHALREHYRARHARDRGFSAKTARLATPVARWPMSSWRQDTS